MVIKENDIAYILAHLNEPETLVEPEFQMWLEDSGHRQLFEEIRSQREAFMRVQFETQVDVDREYKRLESKIFTTGKVIWVRRVSIAACAVVLFTFSLFLWYSRTDLSGEKQLAVLEGKKSAELILANGERINLENNVIELREKDGMLVVNDSNSRLSYLRDSLAGVQSEQKELVYHTISVPAGADYVVVLADGTKVRMNCETKFRFPIEFAGNERKVFLEGEAFFEVKKAQAWPFVVVTDQLEVKVTGTSFNIKSYPAEELVQTTLVSGSVEVKAGRISAVPVHLTPSQQYSLNKRTNQAGVQKVDVGLYMGWTEGMFVFKNQRLEEVMNTLARWYTVDLFYTNTSVKEIRLSANLGRYEHIDSLLEVIRAMDKVNIERKGNVVTISQK